MSTLECLYNLEYNVSNNLNKEVLPKRNLRSCSREKYALAARKIKEESLTKILAALQNVNSDRTQFA